MNTEHAAMRVALAKLQADTTARLVLTCTHFFRPASQQCFLVWSPWYSFWHFFRTPGYSIVNVPDLKGQTALVTGANSGLGLEVALQLARANASVVLACRDAIKCEEAARTVRAEV